MADKLYEKIPGLFDRKNISLSELSEKLGQRLYLEKAETKAVALELEKKGLADYIPRLGKIIFR